MPNEMTQSRPTVADDDVISLSEILDILIKGKWWIAGATLFFAVCSLAYLWVATPVFQSDALVQVESQKSPVGALVDMSDMLGSESPSEAEIEVIRSRFVLGEVVDDLTLDIVAKPDYFPIIGQAVARRFSPDAEANEPLNSPWLWFSGYAWGGEAVKIERFETPDSQIGKTYTLVTGENNRYELYDEDDEKILVGKVGLSAVSRDNQVRLFVSELIARPQTRFNVIRQPMVTAINHLSKRLSVSEKGKKTGVLSLSLSGPSSVHNSHILEAIIQRYVRQNVERVSAEAQNSLKFLEHQLPDMKKDVELAESKLHRFQQENQTVDLTMETQAVLDQAVDIDTQLAQLDMQIKQMGQRYTKSHPVMEELQLQRQLIVDRKNKFSDEARGLPKTQQEVMRLARDVQVNTEVYTELLNKAQELKIVKASAVGNVRILDHALSAIEAVKPKKSLIFVLAVLLGAMLGTGFVFLRTMLRQGVKTPEEIESKTGLSVYATVPVSEQNRLLERNSHKNGDSCLLACSAPDDLAVESLRSLRTNLAFAMMEEKDSRIMITGSSPTVGKSFVSANLALLLAESGKKVLLIDADMRKGRLHHYFAVHRGKGLSDILAGNADSSAIRGINEKCHLLTAGRIPPNPSELLMSQSFSAFLEKASDVYDVVLVDTPPILAVTDAAIIGRQCSQTFLVAWAEKNTASEISYAAKRLQQAKVNVKGCILNGMVHTSSRYGQYGYYHYAYGDKA
ncbi:Tyrosine-protein kinase wzc [invertebrate metagenome]|uniref:Tyrosine-protein kinase wzc n=1 Tax=invertebrate metagenome TaxID=1711999 RepID=A0A2H9T6C5_9ZZZZ